MKDTDIDTLSADEGQDGGNRTMTAKQADPVTALADITWELEGSRDLGVAIGERLAAAGFAIVNRDALAATYQQARNRMHNSDSSGVDPGVTRCIRILDEEVKPALAALAAGQPEGEGK